MRRWAWIGWLALSTAACGGAGKGAESPTGGEDAAESTPSDAKGATDTDTKGDDGDNVRKSAGTPDAKGGPPPATSSQSADDTTAVLELVVNDPELDPYLHLGEPGRFPLKISGSKLPSGLKLVKATEPVQIVGPPASSKDPVLVFTELEITGKKASVKYRYDIEGIKGSATLTKGAYGWELTNSRVVEH